MTSYLPKPGSRSREERIDEKIKDLEGQLQASSSDSERAEIEARIEQLREDRRRIVLY